MSVYIRNEGMCMPITFQKALLLNYIKLIPFLSLSFFNSSLIFFVSVKKKYTPPGALSTSKGIFAKKVWNALKKKPGIVQFWTQTIAETFARDLFSDRAMFNLRACKELRKGKVNIPKY